MAKSNKTYEERLLEKTLVVDGGCWLWQATKNGDGYGRFRYQGTLHGAHRVSYMLYKGDIPEGMCVLHDCDTPSCINPDHLVLGTQVDNIHDMENKGRAVHPLDTKKKKKVSLEDYQEICRLREQGRSHTEIATVIGISSSYVGLLLKHGYEQKNAHLLSRGNERNPKLKVTPDLYQEVIRLHGEGMSFHSISKSIGLSRRRVSELIKYGYEWKKSRKKVS